MTHSISIVTAVHSASAPFLTDAYASLRTQDLPSGWTWEWCVQEDGDGVNAVAYVPADRRVTIRSSRQGGPHVARNMAFARSVGELVRNLDSDDQLTAGALARDIHVLTTHHDVGWTTSAVLDLLPDGSYSSFTLGDPADGRLPRGSMYEYWKTSNRPQVHPATLCVRRPLLALLGGWMALPASEDTGLLLSLDAVADGWFTGETGMVYRKHEGQMTAHPDHSQGQEWEARMSLIHERVAALRGYQQTVHPSP
ncbi:glycosyltransferase family 2 protein [Streptomyces sp. NPDC102264]|uniref:glycosyltransferase family 2 protein n=1 Tax=Streptomyces sp. NPDC102264 TaxID=3366149 RepID=UPI00381DC520